MKYFVTGGAGFIGSNLVDRLLKDGHEVVIYDNFSTGRIEFLENAKKNQNLKIIIGDLLDTDFLTKSMSGCDFVFHLAANADVRRGLEHTFKDLEQNTIVTHSVLEAIKFNNIKKMVFSSTGSVYGNALTIPTPENEKFPIQTSLYGASKVACEGLIEAYSIGFDIQCWIFRFVSIIGEKYQHGHIIDFYNSLKDNPKSLYVLGDGNQKKSYLYVQDCIDGIFCAIKNSDEKINIFNLGVNETISVNESIKIICDYINVNPRLCYSGNKYGWIGDSPMILLDITKINNLGWKPKLTIREGIIKTLDYLKHNQQILKYSNEINTETIIENNTKVYKNHFCLCPCHGRIPWKDIPLYKEIPKYISGHNTKGRTREEVVGREKAKEWINKVNIKNTGTKRSEESKKKMILNHKGFLGKTHNQSTKDYLSKIHIGIKKSKEEKQKQGIIISNKIINGEFKLDTQYFHGYYFSKINNKDIWYRSSYELIAYQLLENKTNIIFIKEWKIEPFRILYNYNDSIHYTIPDILVEYNNGIKQLINIKPLKRTQEIRNILKSEATQKYCEEHDILYSVWTEKELNLITPKEAKLKTLKYLKQNRWLLEVK